MVSRAVVVEEGDVPLERWEDPVRGSVGFRTLVGGSGDTGELSAGVAELRPGEWLGRHRHGPAEVYLVLAGTGTLVAGQETHVVRAGSTVWLPGGVEHGIRNTGGGPLRFFYTFAVDRFSDVDYHFPDEE